MARKASRSTKLTYPWQRAPQWATWAAIDKNGTAHWHEHKPSIRRVLRLLRQSPYWYAGHGFLATISHWTTYDCGTTTMRWQSSLQARPLTKTKPTVDRPKPGQVSHALLMDSDEYRDLYLKYIGTLNVLATVSLQPNVDQREEVDVCMKDARTFLAKRLKFTHKRGRWSIDVRAVP